MTVELLVDGAELVATLDADDREISGSWVALDRGLVAAVGGPGDERPAAARVLEQWVDSTSGAPSRLFGLDGVKGSIRPGLDADLVVFDPDASRRLDASSLHSRCDRSPYEGRLVTGWPAVTISRGDVVAADGEPVDPQPGRGRFVRRSPLAC